VFGQELFSGETVCYGRHQIAGIADPSKLPEWAAGKIALMENLKGYQEDVPTKRPTLQDKFDSAKRKAAQVNITRNETSGDRQKKRTTGGIDVAFKFLMHEYYSKDLSKKIKSALHMLMKNGEYIASRAIYGYRKNSNGKWEFDPITSKVVGEIFNMALDGKTTAQIRDRLFADSCPSPREYNCLNRGKNITPKYLWASKQIWQILTNEQYTGTYIAGKTEVVRVGSTIQVRKDRSEWTIIPDSHPPIVSKEDFARVQMILKPLKEVDGQVQSTAIKGKRKMQPRNYLLRGKIVCGTCGYAMSFCNPNTQRAFRCIKTYVDKAAACHRMVVASADVDNAVMSMIRKQAEIVLGCGDLTDLRKINAEEQQMAVYEKQIFRLSEQRQQCYERFLNKEVDRDTFHALKMDFTTQINMLTNQLAVLKQAEQYRGITKKATTLESAVLNEAATPKDIVDALVEKVLVFPNNHLEIRWKFANFAANT